MKIYTLKEFAKGQIPRKEDFRPALRQFELDCITDFLGRAVYGCLVYGSVLRDDCNEASDIDYLIVINEENHKRVIYKAAEKAKKKRNVTMNPIVIERELGEQGIHTVDSSFRQHLDLCVQRYGFCGKNPLEILADNSTPFKISLVNSMAGYLHKMNKFKTTYSESEQEYLDMLKTIMEKPFHAMRIYIQFCLKTVAPEGAENFKDTKSELIRIYKGLDPHKDLMRDIDEINSVAQQYLQLLKKRLSGGLAGNWIESEYKRMLKEIENCFYFTHHFIKETALDMKDFRD